MSLQLAAQHLASKGRNGDTELVHMTKGEIKGLQELALAHGGSLSINPSTGLPEASFLKNLLPTIAGIGLSMIPGVGPLMAAGIVGGGTALATGDINKGLMAGLGAYGGAGLAGGLSTAGAGVAADTATQTVGSTAGGFGTNAAVDSGTQALANASGSSNALTTQFPYATTTGTGQVAPAAANLGSTTASTAGSQAPVTLSNMGKGIGQLGSEAGRSAVYNALPTGTIPSLGMTAAGAVQDAFTPKAPGVPEEDPRYKGSPYRYNLASNFGGYTPARPNPYYTPTGLGYAAGGDIMMAAGGSYDDEPRGDDQGFGFAAGGSIRGGADYAQHTGGPLVKPIPNFGDAAEPVRGGPGYEQHTGGGLPAPAGVTFDTTPRELGQSNPFSNTAIQNQPIAQSPSQPLQAQISAAYPNPNTLPGSFANPNGYSGFGGFSAGSNGGSGGPFPLQGQYGIVKMAAGGMTLGQGIYKDTDEDTASLGAYDAARKRVEKQFGAANLKAKPMPKSGIARLGEIKTMASGGLGGYSDGGRMLKGPGDGMSDSIPAVIGKKQPARLADGEFVVPADVVSHLGNGSTDAGAKRLYGMMDKVRKARTGKKKQAPAVKAEKYMPA